MAPDLDVSWRCVEALLALAREHAYDTGPLVAALPCDARSLPQVGKVSWDDYCALVEGLEAACPTPEAFDRLGVEHLGTKEVRAIATAFVDVRLLYRFVFSVVYPMMFPPMIVEHEELDDGRLRIALRIRAGARACLALQRLSAGGIRALPTYLGLQPAAVDSRLDARGATHLVEPPPPLGALGALRRTAVAGLDEVVHLVQRFVEEGRPAEARPADGDRDARGRRFAEVHGITPRQSEVLAAVVDGLSNKEIATRLRCTEATVESHVSNLFRRVGVHGRTQLVSRFWQG